MPSFTRTLEEAIHRAVALANIRRHELATLEHLLLALLDEPDASKVMKACGVDLAKLRAEVTKYLDEELNALVSDVDGSEAAPTTGFQRVIQRAAIHVQSSGRTEVTGANVLVAIFAERESHAAYFLQEQDMTRYDAVNFISHGVAKNTALGESRPVRGASDEEEASVSEECGRRRIATKTPRWRGSASTSTRRRAQGRIDPLIGRDHEVERSRSGALPPAQEQPAAGRRSRRRQDGDRRGSREADRRSRGAGGAVRRDDLSRSTWARCWPARGIAATSRSGSKP